MSRLSCIKTRLTDTITDTILTRIIHLLTLNATSLATIWPLVHDYCFECTFLVLCLLPPPAFP